MPDLRSRKITNLNRPLFSKFKVIKDPGAGFKNKLFWSYSSRADIVGFRIYRAIYPKSLLGRNFEVSQRALEVLTPSLSPRWKNNILYNKNYFVKNEKVKFKNGEDTRHEEQGVSGNFDKLDIQYWGFVRKKNTENYEFIDTSVKFGKSYAYIVTAVTRDMRETDFGPPLIVDVQDITPPGCVNNIRANLAFNSVILSISMDRCSDVERFHVYRRRVGDKSFEKIADLPTTKQNFGYLDVNVIPGNEYEYRVYFVDYYGNISWTSPTKKIEFLSSFLKKGAIVDPIIEIKYSSPIVKIIGERNSDRIIGYRIEKKNISAGDKSFSVGKYKDGVSWPNIFLFDEGGKVELDDFRLEENSIYKYRISSISLFGKIESIYVSPPFRPPEANFSNKLLKEELDPISIREFNIDILNDRQDPIYAKISWEIIGDWDYLNIKGFPSDIRVDFNHQEIYFDKIEKGKTYTVFIEVYNPEGVMAGGSKPVILNT